MTLTLCIVALSLLGGGIVWAARDVVRYRIDTDAKRERTREELKHSTVAEERFEKLEQRVSGLERVGVGRNGMVRR